MMNHVRSLLSPRSPTGRNNSATSLSRPRADTDESSWLDRPLFLPTDDDPPQRERTHGLPPVIPQSSSNRLSLASCWSEFVSKYRVLILIATFCFLWPLGARSFKKFTNATDSTFHPVPNSLSARAQHTFSELYSNDWSDPMRPVFMIVLESSSNQSLIENKTSPTYISARNFSLGLSTYLNNTSLQHETKTRVTSYYSLDNERLSQFAKALVTKDGRTALIQINYIIPNNLTNIKPFVNELRESIEMYGSRYWSDIGSDDDAPLFNISYTGLKFFQSDLITSTQNDLRHMDAIVLPIALLLLGWVLPNARTLRLWVVPLVTIFSTICAWSIIMNYVAHHKQITQFTPSVMMSLTLGMGVDYTLFLLSRFLETKIRQECKVVHMIQNGGHVILTSGLTLMCTFLGLCFLPLQMLKSVGIGASVAIGSALLMNFTVVPALLSTTMGKWIIQPPKEESEEERHHNEGGEEDREQSLQVDTANAADLQEVLVDNASSHDCDRTQPTDAPNGIQCPTEKQREENGEQSVQVDAENDADQQEVVVDSHDPDRTQSTDAPNHTGTLCPREEHAISQTSFWYKLGRVLLNPCYSILILLGIVFILMPVARHATKIKSSISFDLLLPSSIPSLKAFNRLSGKMGPGRLSPYRILFDGRSANMKFNSVEGFDVMHRVVDEFMAIDKQAESDLNNTSTINIPFSKIAIRELNDKVQSNQDIFEEMKPWTNASVPVELIPNHTAGVTQYSGIAILANKKISYKVYIAAKACSAVKHPCPFESFRLLDYIDRVVSSSNHSSTYITATLGVNPFSDEGVAWLLSARKVLENLEGSGSLKGVEIHIEGGAAIAYDAVQAVYAAFPTVIAVTTAVIFFLMGFFFRSIATPLRSIVSIALTLGFVFGMGVLVYQHGILEWTGIRCLSESSVDEISWLAPIMAFSIIVGLALDYDVFLISRILEFRMEGYDHRSSILAGLHATGSLITAAGMIMAVAFGGLMLSTSPALYQWSFLLTVAVLLDTFVIRTLVVPIIIGFTGNKISWWPKKLPEERINLFEASLPEEQTSNTTEALLLEAASTIDEQQE